MAWNPAFRLVRPDDLVVLDIRVSGIEAKKAVPPTPGGSTHLFQPIGAGPREIWVQFGPQQVIEYARPEGGVRADQADPLFVPRTDLIFQVPAAQIPFPATVEGVLDVLRRSSLKTLSTDPAVAAVQVAQRSGVDPHRLVAATASSESTVPTVPTAELTGTVEATARLTQSLRAAREGETLARRVRPYRAETVDAGSGTIASTQAPGVSVAAAAGPAALGGPVGLQPPNSQVAMPRRLAVRPPSGPNVRMSHAAAPVTHAGRTELWHSRLAVASTDPFANPVEIDVPVALTALPNTVGVPLNSPRDETLIRNAIFDLDCTSVAAQTQPPYFTANGSPTDNRPARLGRLMLSALGGWLELGGTWAAGEVRELRVDTAQGRDQFQRKVVTGRLMPFGHKALMTSTSVRRFETGGTRVAGLDTVTILQVLEPVVTFDPATGVHAAWPYSSVEILHREPLEGSQGFEPGQGVSTFEVAGLPFQFQCRGIDRSGMQIDFQMPMLFAQDVQNQASTVAFAVWQAYTKIGLPAVPNNTNGRRPEYFTTQLNAQRLGVAAPPSDATLRATAVDASAEPAISPTATTVLARELELALDSANRPVMKQLTARVEALERFAPGTGEVVLEYAKPYLDSLLDGANAQGQVFLQFAKNTGSQLAQPLVGLAGRATAGMAQVNLPIAALSRRFGAVAGELPGGTAGLTQVASTITSLAKGELDLRFLTSTLGSLSSKLLGLVDLNKLIPLDPKPKLADSQKITTDVLDGVTRQTLTWTVPLLKRSGTAPNIQIKPLREGFISLEAVPGQGSQPTDPQLLDPVLTIVQQTEVDAARLEMRSTTTCTMTGLALKVYMSDDENDTDNVPIVTIPFKKISFVTRDGGKPDFDVVLGRIEFGGILQFVRILADFIDQLGLSDPPALEVTTTGVRSSFSFDVPAVAIGMFALQNIAFSTVLDLTFQPTPQQPALLLTVRFASRANPFRLTVSFLGGGGHLAIAAASDGLTLVEGSLQFGASLAVNLGVVAKASIEAMGGVTFLYDRPKKVTRLTAFLQIRGEASVLSLITVSITLLLELSYDFRAEILSGHAEVVVQVSLWFFSQSVTVPYDWEAKTGNSDPTFSELMAPAGVTGEKPWDTYCMAFA